MECKLHPAHCDLRISNCRKSSRLPTLKGSHICRNDIDQTPTTPEGSHINDEIICQENKRKRNPKSIMSLKTNCRFVLEWSLQTTNCVGVQSADYTPTQKNYAANYTKAIVFKLYPAHCDLRISNCRKSSRLPTLKGHSRQVKEIDIKQLKIRIKNKSSTKEQAV